MCATQSSTTALFKLCMQRLDGDKVGCLGSAAAVPAAWANDDEVAVDVEAMRVDVHDNDIARLHVVGKGHNLLAQLLRLCVVW